MRKFRLYLVVPLLAVAIAFISASGAFSKEGKPLKGQVVVMTKTPGIPDAVLARFKGKVKDKLPGQKTHLIEFPDVIPVEKVIRVLEILPFVIYAEPNYEIEFVNVLQISISSPDQYAPPLLLRADPTNYYDQPNNLNIGLESAQSLASGENIIVAVIDNGLKPEHPLFEGRLQGSGYDYIDNDNDPSEEDGDLLGHGTFVSGLILLIASDSKVLPIRAFDEKGVGTTFSIALAIHYAIEHNVDIINMSFGISTYSQLLDSAVATALEKGITLVAAGGNDGLDQITYPAALHGVIAVNSIDSLEHIADFSNYGSFLDVSAPGVNLYSSLAGEYDWGWWSGTSFSAAIVSGVSALIISRRAGLSPLEVESLLRKTTRTDLSWGSILPPDTLYGYGVLDAFNSLIAVGRGDINNSGEVDILDLNNYINFIFRVGELNASPPSTADFNCDGNRNILDLNNIVKYLFRNGNLLDPCY